MSQGIPLRYCRDIKLLNDGWALYARTPQIAESPDTSLGYSALVEKLDAAQWVDATIHLDEIFGNNDGKFVWGGKLNETGRKPTLNGTRLSAELRNTKGEWSTSSVDLDDRLDGMNGIIADRKAYRTGEDGYIRIDSVNIQPLYPVLDEFGQCPGFEFPLTLWSPGMTSANPCTIDMNEGTEISVQITLKQENVTLTGSASNLPCDFRVTTTSPNTTLIHLTIRNSLSGFPVSLPKGIPWGCKREHSWAFNYVAGPEKASYSLPLKHAIEIYGVTPYTNNYKTKPAHYYGIPRDALDFYLVHAKKVFPEPINTLNDYVRSIVYAVHWCSGFAYDTIGGNPCFADPGYDNWCKFNVRLWAYLLRPTTKDDPLHSAGSHHVNCYDQAAAVWTGITLALGPYDVRKLIWRFAEPFGYINPTHLVGWPDKANNPFFMSDRDGKATQIAEPDSRLTSFGNHAFLEFDGGVLDATCGPYVGDVTLDEYLETSIDYESGYKNTLGNTRWANNLRQELLNSQMHKLDLMINRPTFEQGGDPKYNFKAREQCEQNIATLQRKIDQIETFGSATFDYVVHTPGESDQKGSKGIHDLGFSTRAPTDLRTAWPSLQALGITPLCWENGRINQEKRNTLANEPNSPVANRFISVSNLQLFTTELQKQLKWSSSDRHTIKPELRIIDFSPEYCHFSWKARSSATSAVSIDIYMLPNYDDATCWFAMLADPPASNRSQSPLFARTNTSDASKRSIAGTFAGRGNVIHAVGNVVFEAHGLEKNEDLKPFEDFFSLKLLSSARPEPGTEFQLNVRCINATEQKGPDGAGLIKVKKGEKLKFIAEAKNGFGLRCNLNNYWVMVPLQLNPEVSKDNAAFEFLARNSGNETLDFVGCDQWLDVGKMQKATYNIEVSD